MNFIGRRNWPKREFPSPGRRDLLARARFFAFSKLFEFCKSDFEGHIATEDDKAYVYSLTRAFIGEDFEGGQIIAGDVDLTRIAVDQAIDLFLKV